MEFNLQLIILKEIQEDGLLSSHFPRTQIFLKKILIRMEIWKSMSNAMNLKIEINSSISNFFTESPRIQ